MAHADMTIPAGDLNTSTLVDPYLRLRLRQVVRVTTLSESVVKRKSASNDDPFPKPFHLGAKHDPAIGWLQSEIVDWMVQRPRVK
jgi:predicted DNA-binding transcriptional regulator AlpA